MPRLGDVRGHPEPTQRKWAPSSARGATEGRHAQGVRSRLTYIEFEEAGLSRPARVGRMTFSKSGKSVATESMPQCTSTRTFRATAGPRSVISRRGSASWRPTAECERYGGTSRTPGAAEGSGAGTVRFDLAGQPGEGAVGRGELEDGGREVGGK